MIRGGLFFVLRNSEKEVFGRRIIVDLCVAALR